jgi:DNA mismatch repair protein MutL
MSGIRRLPPEVSNRIAAGEVVERPASLVKELVENALDANATRIEVAIEGGGLDMIRVSDDGHGIPADEVSLAFERHATSKLWDPADLVAIRTLGFRGEALASIAAVSRVELRTAPAGGGPGTRIRIEGGEVLEESRAARSIGTTVEVTGLFYNTPARRKFLRTPATEGRVLVQMLGQLALGAEGVGFRVTREGKRVLDIAPGDDFRARARALLGETTVARMVEVRGARDGVEIRGLVAPADFARRRVGNQVLLVNGRPIADPSLAHAVRAGIGGAVPGGRHPIYALAIQVDPGDVDVNVHPTKREVRFRNRDRVFSVIREAVASAVLDVGFDALGRAGILPWRKSGSPGPAAAVRPAGRGRGAGRVRESGPRADERAGTGASATQGIRSATPREGAARPVEAGVPVETGPPASGPTAGDESTAGATPLATRQLRMVGELWGAYLLVEDTDRLLVIDQHAAHERVLYDEIREAAVRGGSVPVQGLLVPLTVDLGPGQDPTHVAEVLAASGFDARPGGPSSVLVDGVPGNLSRWGGGEFLRELFASAEGATASAEKLRDALAKSYACRGAVKFGQRLHPEEIDHLLRSLERTDVPRLCPHGRPIYLEVPRDSIDDRFERT